MVTICIKCQILFSGKNKKRIINLSSAELAHTVVKTKAWVMAVLSESLNRRVNPYKKYWEVPTRFPYR